MTLPLMVGIPRYRPKYSATGIPSVAPISLAISWFVFLEKKTRDLLNEIFWPEALQNLSSTSLITNACSLVASPNRIKSSAKKRLNRAGPPRLTHTSVQRPCPTQSSIRYPRHSMHRANKYGDKGSPYCTPLDGLKNLVFSPFHRTLSLVEVMHVRINSTTFCRSRISSNVS